jgi:regulation of enolase protein 1 (concanavalin A-like superfamily)
MWLVKTDANGVATWNQSYGGIGSDSASALVQTTDGGFALAGYTSSYGAGGLDMWLVKTDANGVPTWNQSYGGTGREIAYALIQTVDGGFALAGYTDSFGADGRDMWLVKTDANGVATWNQSYGGTGGDSASALVQTVDGGFALAGEITKFFGAYYCSQRDMWLVKTDANGVPIWNQSYGGTGADSAFALVQTVDGGFALAGFTESFGAAGEGDMGLVKTDANGVLTWNQSYGGTEHDSASALIQTVDGGFALAGFTESFGAGGYDMWLVKTDANGVPTWNQTYGGTEEEFASALIQTADGGFALAGSSKFGAIYSGKNGWRGMYGWLVKMDANGLGLTTTTATPGLGALPLFVAVIILTTWYKRKK